MRCRLISFVLILWIMAGPQLALSDQRSSGEKVPSNYRGWDFLVGILRKDWIDEGVLASIYGNHRMPKFSAIYFALKPRETHDLYKPFRTVEFVERGRSFILRHEAFFIGAEKRFGVSRYLITAIMLVETQLGQHTGKELVINRLSRVASAVEPQNVLKNYRKLKKDEPNITLEQVRQRAEYLHRTFYPEVAALLRMTKTHRVDLMGLRGSVAGAFGLPQFLPTSFLRFGLDGNGDKHVSLFSEADAIWSTANFIANFGWREGADAQTKKRAIWHYNHSVPYVDTIYWLYEQLPGI